MPTGCQHGLGTPIQSTSIQVTAVSPEARVRPPAFPECQEHLLQSIFLCHYSPVHMKPVTAHSIACSRMSPLLSDKTAFTELPDIYIVIICR